MLGKLLAAVVVLSLVGCGNGNGDGEGPGAGADGEAATAHVVPAGPVGLVADGEGVVWAALPSSGTLVQVLDPDATPADVGDTPLRAASTDASFWVTVFGDGVLAEVDPTTGQVGRQLDVGAEPEGIVEGFDSLWVVLQSGGQLARIDPTSGETLMTVEVGSGPRLVIAGSTSVWVSDFTGGTVVRVDPTTGVVTTSEEICDGPQGMAEVGQVLWVACSRSNELVGVSVEDLSVVETVDAAGTPDALAVGADGSVVVALQEGPALRLLDTESVELGDSTELSDASQLFDQANIDVLVESGTVWLSSYGEATVYELPLSALG